MPVTRWLRPGQDKVEEGLFRYLQEGDGLVVKLSRRSVRGDMVYADLGPGVRIVGRLKDWQSEGEAVIEVNRSDVGIPGVGGYPDVAKVVVIPVGE